jgi:ATP-dependent helicase/nuclease subunit B
VKIYSIPFGADFIEGLHRFVLKDEIPLEEMAIVFAGKRPSLYLKRRLAEESKAPFYSPGFFSMEEFIDGIVRTRYHDFTDLQDSDAIWILYNTIQSLPAFNNHSFKQKGFGDFFYWGRHILDFIDQLDRENILNSKLSSLEENAEIGYDVPKSINDLLLNLSVLRDNFHETLKNRKCFTKGYKYLCALEAVQENNPSCPPGRQSSALSPPFVKGGTGGLPNDSVFADFKKVYFAGLFALTGAEREIVKNIWLEGKGEVIIEGNPEEWQILQDLTAYFGAECEMIQCDTSKPDRISIHSGFDIHSEVIKTYEILKNTGSKKTAVVLPTSEPLFPLLTFAIDRIEERYNISLGYPFSRTSVFDLTAAILDAQLKQRRGHLYPAKNYLEVVLHPFVKNLNRGEDLRTLLLNVEKSLTGEFFESDIANKPFITLGEVEADCGLRVADCGFEGIKNGKESCGFEAVKNLREIHGKLFKNLEDVKDLYEMSQRLEEALTFIFDYSPVRSYVLSGEIFKQLFQSLEDLKEVQFSRERFHDDPDQNRSALCNFVLSHLKAVTLPFETKPVEPLEILGVLETRNIRFDSVIVLDVNEGILPQPKKIDPLVPIGVYDQLGIPSPEYNEEIFRYHFYRLVASAKDVHLLYIDSVDRQRSRYIEQIIWNEEKAHKALNVLPIDKSIYKINLKPREVLPEIEKTEGVLRLLKAKAYSPTAVDDYIRCPILFYYRHILDFEEKKALSEDIDVMDRGNIIHRILCDTFEDFKGREIGPHMHDEVLAKLNKAIEKNFQGRVVTGDFYLFKRLAGYKLEAFLRRNVKNAARSFAIRYLEEPVRTSIDASGHQINLKGRIDRVDFIPRDDEYVIIDYKTGGLKQYPDHALEKVDLHSIKDIHDTISSFQLPLYLFLFHSAFSVPVSNLNAKLILLKNNDEELLFKDNATAEREQILAQYMEGVKTVLRDMLDINKPFKSFDHELCNSCTFNSLCKI